MAHYTKTVIKIMLPKKEGQNRINIDMDKVRSEPDPDPDRGLVFEFLDPDPIFLT